MVNVSIRIADSCDYGEIARIYNIASGLPAVPAENFAESDKSRDPGEYFFRLVVELDCQLRGFCRIRIPLENGLRDEAEVHVYIDPSARRLGLGRRIFQSALETLVRDGKKTVVSSYREDLPASSAFAQNLGFLEYDRYWNSQLNLHRTKLSCLEDLPIAIKRLSLLGIEILPASELLKHPETLNKLHELEWLLDSDVPFLEKRARLTFEQFKKKFDAPDVVKNAWFVAIRGGDFVGMSFHIAMPDGEGLYVDLTGVLPEFRGQGIAKALKKVGIKHACARGLKYLYTSNHASNVGILSINDALGYIREPAFVSVRLPLQSTL